MTDQRLSCVVADDEPRIRERVAELAASNGFVVAAAVADGYSAIEAIARYRPSILFLDIRMPGLSGLEVLARLDKAPDPPATVLVTAYSEHALAAFELAAIDYVLKPLDPERFRVAVTRARAMAHAQQSRAAIERLGEILRDGRPERMTIRDGPRFLRLSPAEVCRFEAMDDYVEVHSDLGRHLVNCRMTHLEHVVPAPPFLRIHRSHLVNLDRVAFADLAAGRSPYLLLGDGTKLPVARARLQEVRDVLAT